MHKVITSAALALALAAAGQLWSDRADAAAVAAQAVRAAGESVNLAAAVACRRHGRTRDRYHCGHAPQQTDASSAGRTDPSGLPDSRRRFSRW